jgi:hypothetical protein
MSLLSNNEEQLKIIGDFASRYEDVNPTPKPNQDSLSNNPYTDLSPLPFYDDNQKVILLNITHRNQRPKSKIPGFRICGGFPNVDRLKDHVKVSGGINAYGCANLLKADAHKKFLICSSWEKQQNNTYVLNKIKDITDKYVATLKLHNEEFKRNKEEHKQGKTGLSQHEKIKKLTSRKELLDKKFDEECKKKKHEDNGNGNGNGNNNSETGEVSRNAEVRKQGVAVISIIEDTTPAVLSGLEDPEPIVIVWGCFEDDRQAKHYIYNTASTRVVNVMLDIVNMYEWAYPSKIEDKLDEITEEFRNPTLDKVMKARKQQKAKVLSYEEWVKKEGMEVPILQILSDKKTEDSTEVETRVTRTDDVSMKVSLMKPGQTFESEEKSEEKTIPSINSISPPFDIGDIKQTLSESVSTQIPLTGQSKFIEVKKVEYIPTIRDEKKSDLDLNSLPRQPMNSITINKDSQLVVTTVDNQINNSNVKCPSEKELQAETPNNEFGIIDNTGEKLQINQLAEVIKDVQIQQQIKRRGRPPKTQNGPKI